MPENESEQQQSGGTPDPVVQAPPVLTLPADAVRNSPEYQELQRQRREDARERGRIEAEAAQIRADAERQLQAAEAVRQQALAEQLQTVLGEDGMAAFNELAELSSTDPVAAGKRFKELMGGSPAQSDGTIHPLPGAEQSQEGEGEQQVSQQQQSASQTPPPPGTGVSGDAPLGQGQIGTDWDEIATGLDGTYAETVKRNQDPVTRARVTDKERGGALMAWLGSAYIRGMKGRGTLPKS